MGNFKEDIARTEAFVFDVDGVFTDGNIMPLADGDFLRAYNAKDGYAVSYAVRQGYKIFIVTGGRGDILYKRFSYLGVTELHVNVSDKIAVLSGIMERHSLDPGNVLFMGDDIPDLECMQAVGLPVCPADGDAFCRSDHGDAKKQGRCCGPAFDREMRFYSPSPNSFSMASLSAPSALCCA